MELNMPTGEPKDCHFLAVENDADEAFLLARAFDTVDGKASMYLCRNVSEAKAYLTGAGIYSDRGKYPIPDALISDLNMPLENGVDLVKWVRESSPCARLRIVILSGSLTEDLKATAESLGVDGVYQKPMNQSALCAWVRSLVDRFCEEREQQKKR